MSTLVDSYRADLERVARSRAALYEAIRREHGAGRSVRAIAAEVGLSPARVGRIVQK